MRLRVVGGAPVVLAAALCLSVAAVAAAPSEGDGPASSPSFEPAPVLATDDLQQALDGLPDPPGDDDAQQLRALLGLPGAFNIAFEPQADGSISRREQWFYFDLSTVFEFVDGTILWNLPLDSDAALMVDASRHDPAIFEATSTWASLAPLMPRADTFEKTPLDDEYGVPATIYVGDQLVLAFDDEDTLLYVEAVPLTAADAS